MDSFIAKYITIYNPHSSDIENIKTIKAANKKAFLTHLKDPKAEYEAYLTIEDARGLIKYFKTLRES